MGLSRRTVIINALRFLDEYRAQGHIVKAAPEHQRLLLDVQQIDTHDRQLGYASTHLPESEAVSTLQAQIAESAADFIAKAGAVEDLQKEIERLEADVAVVAARIASDLERESHTSSAKDAQAIESELASLRVRQSNLEEMELEVMQRLEDAQLELSTLTSSRAEVQADIAAAELALQNRLRDIADERANLARSREEIAGRIPSDLIDLYEQQRDRYGIGAALLTRGMSGGSGLALSETDLAKIRAADDDDVILCPESNCILVRTEESGL